MQQEENKPRLLYFTDPMCPWSYGFTPEISKLYGEYMEYVDLRLVMGGLEVNNKLVLTEPVKHEMARQWIRIQDITGRRFNFNFFNNKENYLYNTEPACRAAVTVRYMHNEVAFDIFKAMQENFFVEGEDLTEEDSLVDVLLKFDVDEDDFLSMFHSENMHLETQDDFDLTSRIGVNVFPSVYLQADHSLTLITRGYKPYMDMMPRLEEALYRVGVLS